MSAQAASKRETHHPPQETEAATAWAPACWHPSGRTEVTPDLEMEEDDSSSHGTESLGSEVQEIATDFTRG